MWFNILNCIFCGNSEYRFCLVYCHIVFSTNLMHIVFFDLVFARITIRATVREQLTRIVWVLYRIRASTPAHIDFIYALAHLARFIIVGFEVSIVAWLLLLFPTFI